MKKQLFLALLLGLFCLGNSSFAHKVYDDGSGEVTLIQPKNQGVSLSFSFPDKYLLDDKNLALPFEITIVEDSKILFSLQSEEKTLILPDLPKGTYTVIFTLGEYSSNTKITW